MRKNTINREEEPILKRKNGGGPLWGQRQKSNFAKISGRQKQKGGSYIPVLAEYSDTG